MSTPTPSRSAPHVQHSFDGDVNILNATFDRRLEIRKALTNLQQDLQRMGNVPTHLKAEIKLCVGGNEAKEHSYTVSVTSSDFDAEDFAHRVSSGKAPETALSASQGPSSSPALARAPNGQQATPAQSTPRPESRRPEDDDDVIEIRPFKRARTGENTANSSLAQNADTESASQLRRGSKEVEEMSSFIKDWHSEWVRQGGWLFDNITKSNSSSITNKTTLEKKMHEVQEVIGQSLNSASATTVSELANIAKLIPWLEHCRKTSADKVQAREERWRSSSATFHDQTRREREAAEKRLEKKLDEQKELLLKLARANDIYPDDGGDTLAESPRRSREESLGAQLTAELNMEAEKGNTSRSDAEHETINIDDD